jgi:CheY-like chemotaxis protein
LEDSGTPASVRADPDRLAQVMTNLLSNAVKFSPSNSDVVVTIKTVEGAIRVVVRDFGKGIPDSFKARIFERFAQADASNAGQKGGTGLGLSIVKQIVDRLGGKVGFADAPGGGTAFHVELPCWEEVTSIATDKEAQPDAVRILLCEDDFDTAITLREQLKEAGFATDFSLTASNALARASAGEYRAILVDLHLPDGDGISLILRLRELPQYRDTPIIVVSGDTLRGRDDLRSSKLNILEWVNKPINFEHLVRVLTKPAKREAPRRPRILHIDDDNVVAQALGRIAEVISVNSIEDAHRAL